MTLTDEQVEQAIGVMRSILDAAENSNHAGETALIHAIASRYACADIPAEQLTLGSVPLLLLALETISEVLEFQVALGPFKVNEYFQYTITKCSLIKFQKNRYLFYWWRAISQSKSLRYV